MDPHYLGRLIAAYLQQPSSSYEPFTPADPKALRASIKPGDILLVEGNNRISGIIKYLTQSTWSHAALYAWPTALGECELVESNLDWHYLRLNRPGLPEAPTLEKEP